MMKRILVLLVVAFGLSVVCSAASAESFRLNIVAENGMVGEWFYIEALGPDSGASFAVVLNENGRSSICCIPSPTRVKVYHVVNGAEKLVITFSIGEGSLEPTVTLHKDGTVSLTVSKK